MYICKFKNASFIYIGTHLVCYIFVLFILIIVCLMCYMFCLSVCMSVCLSELVFVCSTTVGISVDIILVLVQFFIVYKWLLLVSKLPWNQITARYELNLLQLHKLRNFYDLRAGVINSKIEGLLFLIFNLYFQIAKTQKKSMPFNLQHKYFFASKFYTTYIYTYFLLIFYDRCHSNYVYCYKLMWSLML